VQDIDRQNMKLYEENCELKERVCGTGGWYGVKG
jgi:hypothetical protein